MGHTLKLKKGFYLFLFSVVFQFSVKMIRLTMKTLGYWSLAPEYFSQSSPRRVTRTGEWQLGVHSNHHVAVAT